MPSHALNLRRPDRFLRSTEPGDDAITEASGDWSRLGMAPADELRNVLGTNLQLPSHRARFWRGIGVEPLMSLKTGLGSRAGGLNHGPLLMEGARWLGEGHRFVGIAYDSCGVYIRALYGPNGTFVLRAWTGTRACRYLNKHRRR
jgi:hypothetical protein